MHPRRHARDISAALLAVVATSLLAVGSVAEHRQIVDPKGGDTLISGPIARPWVQAHCHAAALAVVFEASGGVVAFPPGATLPCPSNVTNPGGQVTGP